MAEPAVQDDGQTSTIVGIDEAGYGPVMGPLVVSAVAFDVPVAVLKALDSPADGPDLWALLNASVTKKPGRKDPRLAVADSKKLHGKRDKKSDGHSLRLLERAALTFCGLTDNAPTTLCSLLKYVCPHVVDQMSEYPWYAGVDQDLPVDCSEGDLATQRSSLARDMAAAGIRFRGAWAEVLPAGHYNRLVGATRNKAVALFGQNARLIQRIADSLGPRPLRIWADRHGGRVSYLRPLMTAFADAQIEVLEESPERSSYRMTRPKAPWVIRFVAKGETHHMPVALASVMSKYIRELFMIQFNRWWATHVENLVPTAGYYQDGQRFLAEIEQTVVRQKVDRALLVRVL